MLWNRIGHRNSLRHRPHSVVLLIRRPIPADEASLAAVWRHFREKNNTPGLDSPRAHSYHLPRPPQLLVACCSSWHTGTMLSSEREGRRTVSRCVSIPTLWHLVSPHTVIYHDLQRKSTSLCGSKAWACSASTFVPRRIGPERHDSGHSRPCGPGRLVAGLRLDCLSVS